MRIRQDSGRDCTSAFLQHFKREALSSGLLLSVGISAEVQMLKRGDIEATYDPYLFRVAGQEAKVLQRSYRGYNASLPSKRGALAAVIHSRCCSVTL